MTSTPTDTAWLRSFAVKDGVMLGGLTDAQRHTALALVWAAWPAGEGWTEPEVNATLKAILAGPARALDTDHVELRRWLVDTGFLARDGFGRRYRAVALQALDAAARPAAETVIASLAGADPASWVQGLRRARDDDRAARRARHEAARTAV